MRKLASIVVPCRNEKDFIAVCIKSALSQTIGPENLEVLIVDGMSTDGTREIVAGISKIHDNVRLIDNPNKVTPSALNIGIRDSGGDYIIIWGAHAEYAKDFIENSIKLMESNPEVSCVGGPIISHGKTAFGESAAVAMSSIIGVGNAKHRFPEYEGYAEMACFPVFRKEVFDKIGYYDESLIKNQDDEFCFRLRLNGGKIFISPKVSSRYYTRSTPLSLLKQYYEYGKWRVAVLKKHKMPISYRQQIPPLFFLMMGILLIGGIFLNSFLIGVIIPILYLIILLIFGFSNIIRYGLKISLYIPLAIFLLHLGYAGGFLTGVKKFLLEPYLEGLKSKKVRDNKY